MILRLSITAFVINEETKSAIYKIKNERHFARCQIIVHDGGIDNGIESLSANETPNLIIIEAEETGGLLIEKLEALANVTDSNSKILLIGYENDIQLYRNLMDMGISEYLCGTVSAPQLEASINQLFTDPGSIELGRVIACIGARGGTGSSTIAANLADALSQEHSETAILIDLDLSFGTAALSFNLQQRQSIAEALAQPNRLDEVLMERFMLKYNEYLSIIPAPTTLGAEFNVSINAFEVLLHLARQMAAFIILDLPHQWSPSVNEALLDANEVIVTAYPDLANLRDAKNIFDVLRDARGVKSPTRLILNKVGLAKGLELSAKDFEGSIKSLPTLSIPFEPEVYMSAMNNGKSLIENNNRTKSAKLLEELSTIVSGRVSTLKQNQSFFAELPTYLNTQYLREKLEDANLPFKLFKSDK
jgi:pilus assembly protein CpaE